MIHRNHPVRVTTGKLKGATGRVLYEPTNGEALIRSFTPSLMGGDNARFRVSVEHLERIDEPVLSRKRGGKKDMQNIRFGNGNRERSMRGIGVKAGKRKGAA